MLREKTMIDQENCILDYWSDEHHVEKVKINCQDLLDDCDKENIRNGMMISKPTKTLRYYFYPIEGE
jgi:hypothetical protein